MSTSVSPVAESTPLPLFLIDPQTPATSVYSPTDVDDPLTSEWKPLEKLNSFLESRDISPVRHPRRLNRKRLTNKQSFVTHVKQNKRLMLC